VSGGVHSQLSPWVYIPGLFLYSIAMYETIIHFAAIINYLLTGD
jgi:hypothetical protein